MPDDISMCIGGECPIKNKCYRYRSIPDYLQSYVLAPYDFEKKSCELFIGIKPWDKLKVLSETMCERTKNEPDEPEI